MKVVKGQFVEFDGLLAVVVGVEGDPNIPSDHVALWFGRSQAERKSEGGSGGYKPEIYTVPMESCEKAHKPEVFH